MLSLFYNLSDVKINKNVHLTVFKPDLDQQILLVKGKLGQFKIKWKPSIEDYYPSEEDGLKERLSKSKAQENPKSILWVFDDIKDNIEVSKKTEESAQGAAESKKKNAPPKSHLKKSKDIPQSFVRRHFVFKKSKIGQVKVEDKRFCTNPFSYFEGYPITGLKKKDLNNYWISTWPTKVIQSVETDSKLKIGFISGKYPNRRPKKNSQGSKEKNEAKSYTFYHKNFPNQINSFTQKRRFLINGNKIDIPQKWIQQQKSKNAAFSRQFKNCMKGVTQGYTVNLKLDGVGFEAKGLEEDPNLRCSSLDAKTNQKNTFGTLSFHQDKKFQLIKYYSSQSKKSLKELPCTESKETNVLKGRITEGQDINKILENDCKGHLKALQLTVGKSHSLLYRIPWRFVTISKDILSSTGIISIFSISLLAATQVAADIRSYRKVEAYKGKGIKFDNEIFVSKKEKK